MKSFRVKRAQIKVGGALITTSVLYRQPKSRFNKAALILEASEQQETQYYLQWME